MEDLRIYELVHRFENDIIFDCHSLAIKTSRSQSSKDIIREGPAALATITEHLKHFRAPKGAEVFDSELRHAWGILLSWLCKEHGLQNYPASQRDFNGWVGWLVVQTHALA
jgi:hypothetical protein